MQKPLKGCRATCVTAGCSALWWTLCYVRSMQSPCLGADSPATQDLPAQRRSSRTARGPCHQRHALCHQGLVRLDRGASAATLSEQTSPTRAVSNYIYIYIHGFRLVAQTGLFGVEWVTGLCPGPRSQTLGMRPSLLG